MPCAVPTTSGAVAVKAPAPVLRMVQTRFCLVPSE